VPFKFEKLEVWQLALEYIDQVYQIAERLPRSEEYNLKSQITRAATSVALNIAEGSTSQSDPEQARFLSMAIRSVLETVACQHIIRRRSLLQDAALLDQTYKSAETLVAKLHAMRKALMPESTRLREETAIYTVKAE
jgi:four helix bundle protein